MKTKNALKQAELIVKLYEIRRETALRTARDYVGGEFLPKSVDEFVNLVKEGGKQSGHILQVYGYWDMVAAFVVLHVFASSTSILIGFFGAPAICFTCFIVVPWSCAYCNDDVGAVSCC